mgnify:CR=1 FL=1
MSGKRFSGLERMTTSEFEAAVSRTKAILNKYPVKYCFPKNIRSKDSFGDVDVYVHADEPTMCRIVAELLFLEAPRQFNSFDSIRKVDPNGHVFGKVGNQIFLKTRNRDSDKPIMIDLNLCDRHKVEFESLYHSYGHASLLIDTLASKLNMHWKDDGLYLRANKQNKILITSNIETAMDILWLDASAFDFGWEGFNHQHNLFAWIVASKLFDPDSFRSIGLDSRKHNSPLYQEFLKSIAFIEQKCLVDRTRSIHYVLNRIRGIDPALYNYVGLQIQQLYIKNASSEHHLNLMYESLRLEQL